MTKNLYLLRHGEAEHGQYQADITRKLTERGVNKLRSLGIEMKGKSFFPDKVYCSTAVRTRETAATFLEQIGYDRPVLFLKEIYEASVKSLFDIVTSTEEDFATVLLIGHNPGITYLMEYLVKHARQSLAPGDLVGIEFENLKWSEVSKEMGTKMNL